MLSSMREEEMRTSSSGYFGEGVRRRFGGPWFGLYWWVVGGLPRPGKLGKIFPLLFFFCFVIAKLNSYLNSIIFTGVSIMLFQ